MSVAGAVQSFRALALEFRQYLEAGDLEPSSLAEGLRRLDAAARELPFVEPSETEYADPADLDDSCRQVAGRIGAMIGHRCFYELEREGEPTIGDLRDDLADIYRDLRRGLTAFEESEADGIWEWRFNHEVHWGIHARDALVALSMFGDE
jgi:hypothetical protein